MLGRGVPIRWAKSGGSGEVDLRHVSALDDLKRVSPYPGICLNRDLSRSSLNYRSREVDLRGLRGGEIKLAIQPIDIARAITVPPARRQSAVATPSHPSLGVARIRQRPFRSSDRQHAVFPSAFRPPCWTPLVKRLFGRHSKGYSTTIQQLSKSEMTRNRGGQKRHGASETAGASLCFLSRWGCSLRH